MDKNKLILLVLGTGNTFVNAPLSFQALVLNKEEKLIIAIVIKKIQFRGKTLDISPTR
jgi:hypothetical protein